MIGMQEFPVAGRQVKIHSRSGFACLTEQGEFSKYVLCELNEDLNERLVEL